MSSVSSVNASAELQVRVAKLQLDDARQQGQAAIQLIEASSAVADKTAPPNTDARVGRNLNVVA